MDVPVLADQQEVIYISDVWTKNVIWKTCRERRKIGTDRERQRETERQRERKREKEGE